MQGAKHKEKVARNLDNFEDQRTTLPLLYSRPSLTSCQSVICDLDLYVTFLQEHRITLIFRDGLDQIKHILAAISGFFDWKKSNNRFLKLSCDKGQFLVLYKCPHSFAFYLLCHPLKLYHISSNLQSVSCLFRDERRAKGKKEPFCLAFQG